MKSNSFFGETEYFKAVNGVSFSVEKEGTFAVVGESGSGKSTLGKSVMRLIDITEGSVFFEDKDITTITGEELRFFRQNIQIIFQDPYSSLNPRHRIKRIITEPLIVFNRIKKDEIDAKAAELLKRVGLPESAAEKYPHQFSGGQRQRVGIARAIALNPKLIICDEPVSALDVSVQAQILNLMMDLKEQLGLSYIFISHDLAVVENISDNVAVMYAGEFMEFGTKDDIFNRTAHPYTKLLISSVPEIGKDISEKPIITKVADELNKPPGENACPFCPRCPDVMDKCRQEKPGSIKISANHYASCFLLES